MHTNSDDDTDGSGASDSGNGDRLPDRAKILYEIARLDIKPGDILHVKLGDPATGWIPNPQDVDEVLDRFRTVLPDGACAVATHYAAKVRVLHAAPGDVVVVRFGDVERKWCPGKEHREALVELFELAFPEAHVVAVPAGAEVEVEAGREQE